MMLALAGCGSSGSVSSEPAATTDTTPLSDTTTSDTTTSDTTTSDTTTSGTTTSGTPTASGPAITGYGATREQWDANHQADDRFAPGSVYDPDPSINPGDQLHNARYYTVNSTAGRILDYSMRFPPHTSITAARGQAMDELPPDAHVRWYDVKDTCSQMVVESRTLGRVLGGHIGDPSGAVLVEFTTGEGYEPSNVTEAIFGLGGSYGTAQSSPGC
jgi:hypothetical protein